MGNYPKHNPRIPEGINHSEAHPIKEFFTLVIGVSFIIIVIVFILAISVQKLAPFIPFEWEQKMAEQFKFQEQVKDQFKDQHKDRNLERDEQDLSTTAQLEPHSHIESALERLLDDISPHMDLPKEMTLHIHYIDTDIPNAFATLGGHLFITKGLLKTVTSENALAMVVTHEIGHIKYRHPIQSLSTGVMFQLLAATVLGNSGNAGLILNQTGLLTLLSFNRDMEYEADKSATDALLIKYGHLNGADQFFQAMLEQTHQHDRLEFFNTHPNTDKRIEKIRSLIKPDQEKALTPLDPALHID